MKMCELCGLNPATIPDRNRQGRPIKRICAACHSRRLSEDMKKIITKGPRGYVGMDLARRER